MTTQVRFSAQNLFYHCWILIVVLLDQCLTFHFQLSFILQSLRHYDVFCFAEFLPMVDVVVCDILKSVPSDDDREVASW